MLQYIKKLPDQGEYEVYEYRPLLPFLYIVLFIVYSLVIFGIIEKLYSNTNSYALIITVGLLFIWGAFLIFLMLIFVKNLVPPRLIGVFSYRVFPLGKTSDGKVKSEGSVFNKIIIYIKK